MGVDGNGFNLRIFDENRSGWEGEKRVVRVRERVRV